MQKTRMLFSLTQFLKLSSCNSNRSSVRRIGAHLCGKCDRMYHCNGSECSLTGSTYVSRSSKSKSLAVREESSPQRTHPRTSSTVESKTMPSVAAIVRQASLQGALLPKMVIETTCPLRAHPTATLRSNLNVSLSSLLTSREVLEHLLLNEG